MCQPYADTKNHQVKTGDVEEKVIEQEFRFTKEKGYQVDHKHVNHVYAVGSLSDPVEKLVV